MPLAFRTGKKKFRHKVVSGASPLSTYHKGNSAQRPKSRTIIGSGPLLTAREAPKRILSATIWSQLVAHPAEQLSIATAPHRQRADKHTHAERDSSRMIGTLADSPIGSFGSSSGLVLEAVANLFGF